MVGDVVAREERGEQVADEEDAPLVARERVVLVAQEAREEHVLIDEVVVRVFPERAEPDHAPVQEPRLERALLLLVRGERRAQRRGLRAVLRGLRAGGRECSYEASRLMMRHARCGG